MKATLRPGFAIQIGKEVVVGPAEVEISEADFQANEHKFEAAQAAAPADSGKKKKADK